MITQTDNIEQPGYRELLEDCGRILHARRISANKSRGHREDKAAMVDLYLDLDIPKQRVLYYFTIGHCGEVMWCGETPKLVSPPSRSIGKFINARYIITQLRVNSVHLLDLFLNFLCHVEHFPSSHGHPERLRRFPRRSVVYAAAGSAHLSGGPDD